MDVAVGIRWPVMEDKPGPSLGRFPDLMIEPYGLPFFEDLGFSLREAGFHRKGSLWKI